MKYIFTTALAICFIANSIFSQQTISSQNWCGSTEMMNAHFKKHPELKQKYESYNAELTAKQNSANTIAQKTAIVNYTIPVVFHVLHQYGAENISDAQIADQIAILNRDYNLQNTDTSVVIPSMKSAIGNIHFNFVLAKKDPNGNCTNGITRHYDANTLSWEGNWSDYLYTWPSSQYLNFYVVKGIASGAAGYAYYPGSLGYDDQMDAIVILQDYVGSTGTSQVSHSRAVTHEVGHWFNLAHVWGSTNNPGVACDDDGVTDTPETKGFTMCPSMAASAVCNVGIYENYQNYMDYSYCCVMFTNGQGVRMNLAANSSIVGRDNLGSAANLSAVGISPTVSCAPVAISKANRTVVCAGESVVYTDQSTVGVPNNWSWEFEGGSPNVSAIQNPTVTYNTPGTYSVQFVSGNSAGSSSPEIKTNYIIVLPSPTSANIIESFEGTAIPNSMWSTKNYYPANMDWMQTNSSSATGNNSIYVDENITQNSVVEVYSPAINFASISNPAMTIKWAGAERNTTTTAYDVFSIQFSSNCGLTWSPRLTRNIKTGSTGVSGVVNGSFYPTPSQYRQEVIPLSGYTTGNNVIFKLKFTAEPGSSNNFYVDDINITSVTKLKEEISLLNIEVFPNPAKENVNITFDLLDDKRVGVNISNVLSQTIKIIEKQNLNTGSNTISIPVSDLSKGIYFINIDIDGAITSQKLIIE